MSKEITKPKFPEGASSWWNLPRKDMTVEQKELRRTYDRELRAFHRLDPSIKKRDNNNYKTHVEKNKETVYERNSKWRQDNWEAVYKQRKESGSQARGRNNWYHNKAKYNIEHVLKERLRQRVRDTITKGYKSASTLTLLGCDINTFKNHLHGQFTLGMSWDNYGDWHIDHIIPCDSFDLTIPEEQAKCFHYTNCQPLWAKDNIIKGNKLPINL
jgi:hypothetical protein